MCPPWIEITSGVFLALFVGFTHCLRCYALSEKSATCSIVNLLKIYVLQTTYVWCISVWNKKYIFYILCELLHWKSCEKNNFLNRSNSRCTLRTCLFIYVLFICSTSLEKYWSWQVIQVISTEVLHSFVVIPALFWHLSLDFKDLSLVWC